MPVGVDTAPLPLLVGGGATGACDCEYEGGAAGRVDAVTEVEEEEVAAADVGGDSDCDGPTTTTVDAAVDPPCGCGGGAWAVAAPDADPGRLCWCCASNRNLRRLLARVVAVVDVDTMIGMCENSILLRF